MTKIEGTARYSGTPGFDYSTKTLTGDIREVTGAEAPVAVRVPASTTYKTAAGSPTADIRTLDGVLYAQSYSGYGQDRVPVTPGTPDLSSRMNLSFGVHDTEQEARDAILDGLRDIILIDNCFWIRIAEPVLVLDRHGLAITVSDDHIFAPWRVYSLAEAPAAVEAAGLRRRDCRMTAEPHASALDPGVEVIMPEVLTTLPHAARMQAVHDQAEAKAAAAVKLLEDFTPRNLHEASLLLAKAADDLNAQTMGMTWNGGSK